MRKKELTDLRTKTKEELTKKRDEMRIELMKAIAEAKVSKEKNLKKVKNLRHNLSQLLTIAREKEITDFEKGKDTKNDQPLDRDDGKRITQKRGEK